MAKHPTTINRPSKAARVAGGKAAPKMKKKTGMKRGY